jgi:hypothetical protein
MSSDISASSSGIPRFNGREENWLMWRAKIIGYFVAHDLMCVIEGEEMKHRAEAVATSGGAPRKQENKKQSASSASALPAEDPLLVAKRRKVYGVLMLTLDVGHSDLKNQFIFSIVRMNG